MQLSSVTGRRSLTVGVPPTFTSVTLEPPPPEDLSFLNEICDFLLYGAGKEESSHGQEEFPPVIGGACVRPRHISGQRMMSCSAVAQEGKKRRLLASDNSQVGRRRAADNLGLDFCQVRADGLMVQLEAS